MIPMRAAGVLVLPALMALGCESSHVGPHDDAGGGSDDRPTTSEVGHPEATDSSERPTEAGTDGTDAGRDAIDGGPVFCPTDAGPADGATLPDAARIGASCSPRGLLSCDDSDPRLALICAAGGWQERELCGAAQSCDLTSGVCANVSPGCLERTGGFAFCDGDDLTTCGPDLVNNSTVRCCGACRNGVCGPAACGDAKLSPGEECDDGNTTPADGCEPDCTRSHIVALAAGVSHTCALLSGGRVRCWGANSSGQLGTGAATDLRAQKPWLNPIVGLGAPVSALAAGRAHTCGLLADGAVRCWGDNSHGQLGLGHTRSIGDDELPDGPHATVPLNAAAVSVAAGGDVTCAILQGGGLRCWGQNDYGQLGLGHTHNIGDDELPTADAAGIFLERSAQAVATGGQHTCVISSGNYSRCWGRNDLDQLGIGQRVTIGDDELPTTVAAIDWTIWPSLGAIVAELTRAYVWRSDQSGFSGWGDNGDGGLGTRYTGSLPTYLANEMAHFSLKAATLGLAAGGYHVCVRLQNHEMRCFGLNAHGQLGLPNTDTLGNNETIDSVPAIDLGVDSEGFAAYPVSMAAGGLHTCAVLNTKVLKCWGYNADGQLGLGFVSGAAGSADVGGTPDSIPRLLPPVEIFGPGSP